MTNDFMIVHGGGLQTSIAKCFFRVPSCSLLLEKWEYCDRLNLYLSSNVSDKVKGSAEAPFQGFQWYPIN